MYRIRGKMNQQYDDAAIKKPKGSKVAKGIFFGVLAVVTVFVLLFVGSGIYFFSTPSSALDLSRSIGVRATYTGEEDSVSKPIAWYDNVEQAIDHHDALSTSQFVSEPLAEKETSEEYNGVYFFHRGENQQGLKQFIVLHLRKDGTQIEGILKNVSWIYVKLEDLHNGSLKQYAYEEEDTKVAGYLTERMSREMTESEVYYFKYFGVSEDPAINNLTILDRAPDDVIEYEYEGVTYYFWYYDKNKPDFYQYLLDYPDFDFGNFTLAQMIEVLEIKVG